MSNLDSSPIHWVCIVVLLIGLSAAVIRLCFGTINIPAYWREKNELDHLNKRYNRLFESREGLVYHISWAKSRGDFDDANRMIRDLDSLDLV